MQFFFFRIGVSCGGSPTGRSVHGEIPTFALRRLALVPCLISLASGPCFRIPRTKKRDASNNSVETASHDGFVFPVRRIQMRDVFQVTLPKTNIAPTNGWLEYYFPIGFRPIFRGENVSFREGNCPVAG